MRIIIVVYDISKMAGSEHGVANLASWLAEKQGHEVSILTANLESGVPAYPLPGTVKVERLGLPRYPRNKLAQVFWHRKALDRLREVLKSATDAVVVGSWSNLNILLGGLARRDRANCYVGWENMPYDSVGFARKLVRLRYYRSLAQVVVLTNEDRRRYQARGLSNVTVVPVAYPFFLETPSSCEAKRIVSVGRLEPQKGFDFLIDVARRLKSSFPEWEFVINGRGKEEARLKRMAEKAGVASQVRFVPRTEDISSLYASGSIYAMTSRYEGFPMVLLEAMACGLPCVSFDCKTGPREVIVDGENGYLVPVGDTPRFAERLAVLIEDADERKRMSKASRAKAREFSPERVYRIWTEAIDEAVAARAQADTERGLD